MAESDVLRIVAAHDLSKQAQAVLDRIISERDEWKELAEAQASDAKAGWDRVRKLEQVLRSHGNFHCTCGFTGDHVLTANDAKDD
jgi:hypothetical protein